MEDIRIGVVGIGHLGNYHLEKYEKLPGCRITAVADLIPERALRAADRYSCTALTDYRDMLGAVDAVSIAVPAKSHYEVARDFLRWGVDVLLEKPIADSIEDADELISIADEKKAVLQVGFVERFNPAIIALGKCYQKAPVHRISQASPLFQPRDGCRRCPGPDGPRPRYNLEIR